MAYTKIGGSPPMVSSGGLLYSGNGFPGSGTGGTSSPAQRSINFNGGAPIESVQSVQNLDGLSSVNGFSTFTRNYWTICVRMKPATLTPSASLEMFSLNDSQLWLQQTTANKIRFKMGAFEIVTANGFSNTTDWHSVVVSFFVGTDPFGWGGKIWVDGVLEATQAPSGPSIDSGTFWAGRQLRMGWAGSLNVGKICQFAWYANRTANKSDAVCAAYHALDGSVDVTTYPDWADPYFYVRSVETDDLAVSGGVQNFGSSRGTFTFKGNNMTNALNLSLDVPE